LIIIKLGLNFFNFGLSENIPYLKVIEINTGKENFVNFAIYEYENVKMLRLFYSRRFNYFLNIYPEIGFDCCFLNNSDGAERGIGFNFSLNFTRPIEIYKTAGLLPYLRVAYESLECGVGICIKNPEKLF